MSNNVGFTEQLKEAATSHCHLSFPIVQNEEALYLWHEMTKGFSMIDGVENRFIRQ